MGISNAQRQYIRELRQRTARRKYGTFLVEGLVNVIELLHSQLELEFLIGTEVGLLALDQRLSGLKMPAPERIEQLSTKIFDGLSSQVNPSGVLAVAKTPAFDVQEIASSRRMLFLDGINDPGNAGTLVRTAEWFGLDAVCSSPESVDWYNSKTVAAARGSLFRLPHASLTLEEVMDCRQNSSLLLADFGGIDSYQFAWPAEGVLLIGNESHGPSEAARVLANAASHVHTVTISGASQSTESLNAAIAGAILMSDWSRSPRAIF